MVQICVHTAGQKGFSRHGRIVERPRILRNLESHSLPHYYYHAVQHVQYHKRPMDAQNARPIPMPVRPGAGRLSRA
jgi:hypothetical protein